MSDNTTVSQAHPHFPDFIFLPLSFCLKFFVLSKEADRNRAAER